MNKFIPLFLILFSYLSPAMGANKLESKDPALGLDRSAISIISNSELAASLSIGESKTRVSGRMSLSLHASHKDLTNGIVHVTGWNVAMFSVPQGLISGRGKKDQSQGILGFAANTQKSVLKYDRQRNILRGEIAGYIDTAYLATLVKKIEYDKRAGGPDFFETATQPATLNIEVKLAKPLEAADNEGIKYNSASTRGTIQIKPITFEGKKLPGYQLELYPYDIPLEIAPWWYFETAKRLCVQPVRISRLKLKFKQWGLPIFAFQTTGAGLAFGQPGVTMQWNKADVTFTYRDWKTLYKPDYWVTTDAGTEEENLRAEVDDDDCIEVFFVNDFEPEDAHGGGAAWGGGTAGSKIITSDANARYGIDFTHLAHELGHVIGLHHPWEAATANLTPASTGTLMCGSGFKNDNPTINSQENKDSISNPLLTFAFKVRTAGPDCQNDADCGACP